MCPCAHMYTNTCIGTGLRIGVIWLQTPASPLTVPSPRAVPGAYTVPVPCLARGGHTQSSYRPTPQQPQTLCFYLRKKLTPSPINSRDGMAQKLAFYPLIRQMEKLRFRTGCVHIQLEIGGTGALEEKPSWDAQSLCRGTETEQDSEGGSTWEGHFKTKEQGEQGAQRYHRS